MNSNKLKKKSDSAKIPKPIKIKKEDDHIMYPMEHYVDDRVELIRQIFSSLKPKTITNLAPEFLKKNKLEDIQEQCLNEILGISKKRLLSIINSTKCPTDTETSSEDDINSIEEHISLEEISSDSDIAVQKGSKGYKGDGKKKQKVKGETVKENNKQFSVLELLELQARARAIRSQLALEPVTKIEVDTDSDEKRAPPKKPATSCKKVDKTTNGRSTPSKPCSTKRLATATVTLAKHNGEPTPSTSLKRIKLKRNFRQQKSDDTSNDETKHTEKTFSATQEVEPKKEIRSPSPDVIPIISVPETLCISDSDDDNVVAKKVTQNVDTLKHVESLESVKILSVVNIEAPKILDSKNESMEPIIRTNDSPKETTPIETEEGEILEEEDTLKENPQMDTLAKSNASKPDKSANEEILKEKGEEAVQKESEELLNEKKEPITSKIDDDRSIPEASKPHSVDSSESEDDANDDVISLEGGDLLNEMREHLEDDVKETIQIPQVICLDDSSEEETADKNKTESWNERWLKSSKVSKVLAASRLGNRVRNKIKKSNKAKKFEVAALNEFEQTKPQEVVFTSTHEDGSVEQYKEILENSEKKTN